MTRHNDQYLTSLAHAGIHHLAEIHDPSGFSLGAADGPRELAVTEGTTFGLLAGRLLLAAVAASDDPPAAAVAGRSEELQDLAAGNGSQPCEQGSTADPAAIPPFSVPAKGGIPGAEAMLEQTRKLLDLGAELAAVLREATVSVEPGGSVTELADWLKEWSEVAPAHLGSAASAAAWDLIALSEELTVSAAACVAYACLGRSCQRMMARVTRPP